MEIITPVTPEPRVYGPQYAAQNKYYQVHKVRLIEASRIYRNLKYANEPKYREQCAVRNKATQAKIKLKKEELKKTEMESKDSL